ncbi:hypothetical protein RN001_012296 [Aquatica leii]|uniref:Uncharacterized protein n=1 Tax=Aquatica leii TaxID=1421715 RepID=A0AAN7P2U3_9COLE|nr:hypothetical protein RN001_012296 [Aquatica leii]
MIEENPASPPVSAEYTTNIGRGLKIKTTRMPEPDAFNIQSVLEVELIEEYKMAGSFGIEMATPAVFCLGYQLNTSSTSLDEKVESNEKQMHDASGSLNDSNRELNGNIILLRGSKLTENGHILLRTDNLNYLKNNIVVDDSNGKVGQLLVQQSDLTDGLLLHSVKRLGNGAPIFLLSGNDNGNGHILIQTSPGDDAESVSEIVEDQIPERISLRAVDACPDEETTKSITVPLGSVENAITSLYSEQKFDGKADLEGNKKMREGGRQAREASELVVSSV